MGANLTIIRLNLISVILIVLRIQGLTIKIISTLPSDLLDRPLHLVGIPNSTEIFQFQSLLIALLAMMLVELRLVITMMEDWSHMITLMGCTQSLDSGKLSHEAYMFLPNNNIEI